MKATRNQRGLRGSDVTSVLGGAVLVGFAIAGCSVMLEKPARTFLSAAAEDPAVVQQRERSVYYSGCREARAAGAAPIYRGEPGYRPEMDGDNDGIACEPYRGS